MLRTEMSGKVLSWPYVIQFTKMIGRWFSPSKGLPGNMQQVAPTPNRPLCNEVQQQANQICVTSARPPGLAACQGKIWTHMPSHQQPSCTKWWKSCRTTHAENHSDCSWVAQGALVLGSSGHVQPNPTDPAQPAHTTIQSDSTQESVKPKSICVAPTASAIKEQGFSEAVAARIEAPQRGSTRSIKRQSGPFLQSGAPVIRWTSGNPL